MRGLRTLIRLHRAALDEKRRAVAVLERRRDEIDRGRETLARQLADEQRRAAGVPELMLAFGAYANRVRRQRELLAAQREALEPEIVAASEQVAAAFAELKKYEIALDLRERRAAAEAERRERIELDEIGLSMHRRRAP